MTDRDVERFWQKVQKQTDGGCWVWTACKDHKGYGMFWWTRDAGDSGRVRAHRFSWELHHGPIPQELCVLHKCDVPLCVRPDHLWIGTQVENVRDMKAKGRGVRGEQQGSAKLNPEKILEIRALVAAGTSRAAVARQFGVCESSIDQIVRGETWRHVKGDECSAVCGEDE